MNLSETENSADDIILPSTERSDFKGRQKRAPARSNLSHIVMEQGSLVNKRGRRVLFRSASSREQFVTKTKADFPVPEST